MSNSYAYNGIDLRTASVFDFTDDKTYLLRFLCPEIGINTIDDYIAMAEPTTHNRVSNLIDYAEEYNLYELLSKLKHLYKEELDSFFNE